MHGRRVFNRAGPLSPALLVSLLLFQVRHGDRRGYARMLDAFWDEASGSGLELPCEDPVTAQAFCAARRKLPPELLRTLLNDAADAFDRDYGESFRFRGRRLLAVDGARRFVRRSDELRREFGSPGEAHYPQAHVTTLFDVLSKVPLDVVLGPTHVCERRQLSKVLGRTRKGDVAVLDAGYPSFDVFVMLIESGLDFVARMPMSHTFTVVEEFVAGGDREATIELPPSLNSVLQGHPPIRVRIVREQRGDADPWILITTLRADEFDAADIAKIYGLRWPVEEYYKLLVAKYFGQGQFHAKWVGGVEQEIYAQMLFVVITRSLMAAASQATGVPYEHLSQKGAILAVGDHLTRLVLRSPPRQMETVLQRLLKRIARAVEKPRPGRSSPRRSLQPQRRWTAAGRRGGG